MERVHVGIDAGREERVGFAAARGRRESGRDGADLGAADRSPRA